MLILAAAASCLFYTILKQRPMKANPTSSNLTLIQDVKINDLLSKRLGII